MSFHKRRYNWPLITEKIKSGDFEEFDRWIFKPDAHMLQDQESSDFFKAYCCLSEKSRELLFESIKEESEDFYKDLIKCVNVVFDPTNNELHDQSIKVYSDLFMVKWDNYAIKYKSIIEK